MHKLFFAFEHMLLVLAKDILSVCMSVCLQVIDGGDLDIDFSVYAPDNRVVQMESRKTENVVR